MNEQQFENLAKKWPGIFQKAKVTHFDIGEGWITLIDTLCGLLSYKLETAQSRLQYSIDAGNLNKEDRAMLEAVVAKELEDLPTIIQVKEKYGGLRFHVDNSVPEYDNYISFSESMSMVMCEECGAPGEPRSDGWTKTLCERHHRERERESDKINNPHMNIIAPHKPKLAEE